MWGLGGAQAAFWGFGLGCGGMAFFAARGLRSATAAAGSSFVSAERVEAWGNLSCTIAR